MDEKSGKVLVLGCHRIMVDHLGEARRRHEIGSQKD
jgi:hypothetical protein